MEKEPKLSLEQLMAEKEKVAKEITDLDAAGKTGEELNILHKKHEELTSLIEEMPNADEMDKAA